MVATASAGTAVGQGAVERKPLLSPTAILLMNVGYFGIWRASNPPPHHPLAKTENSQRYPSGS
jgi:hypothetical protein